MRATLDDVIHVDVRPIAADDLASFRSRSRPSTRESGRRHRPVTCLVATGARELPRARARAVRRASTADLLGGSQKLMLGRGSSSPVRRGAVRASRLPLADDRLAALEAAERLAGERGYQRIGLAVPSRTCGPGRCTIAWLLRRRRRPSSSTTGRTSTRPAARSRRPRRTYLVKSLARSANVKSKR